MKYTIDEFKELGGYDEKDPLERLKFFCSLGLCSEDWLEVESFFIDAQDKITDLEHQLSNCKDVLMDTHDYVADADNWLLVDRIHEAYREGSK